jgi:hypothetical protein
LGDQAGYQNSSGNDNIAIGFLANRNNQTGGNNIFIGNSAGESVSLHSKSNNTVIGHEAGFSLNSGDNGNILLGYQAGYNETGSNKLYVENSNSATPLIWGDFANDLMTVNGALTVTEAADPITLEGLVIDATLDTVLVSDVNGVVHKAHIDDAGAGTVTVSGNISEFLNSNNLEDVTVQAYGDFTGTTLTDAAGNYSFTVPTNSMIHIVPRPVNISYASTANFYIGNDGAITTISTLDIITITQHLLGVSPFTSPFEFIAADVTNDGAVTDADTDSIAQLILGAIVEYPNAPSWKFVPSDYVFPDPLKPLAANYMQEKVLYVRRKNITGVDFTGVKLGNLTGASNSTL